MPTLSRRALLSGSASTAAVLTMAPSFLEAFITGAKAQAAGFNRYKVGAIEVMAVNDGAYNVPLGDTFVVNKKKEEVSAALKAAGLDGEKLNIPINPTVFKNGKNLVVIDTGERPAAAGGPNGQFQKNLAAAGYKLEDVTHVVISHFHGDHMNGLLGADNKPSFPKAQILVPAPEWAYFMNDDNMKKAPPGRMEGVFKNARRVFDALDRKVTQYQWGRPVLPGLTAVGTPGHTPGHTSFTLASGRESIFIQSDVTNIPALFLTNPGWHVTFDQDPKQAEATRRKTYDQLAAQKTRVQGFHFPFPALGRIEKTATGYKLHAA
ncbi:MAG: MBL fold metallo-hydrolase [Xanthobacteraceae bacterium]|nr:MBL fold metallo-hydrolase [Xanthobacteraceae bacterium]QYK43941.1 MAG: MBL fold metallo-hydrolase [Xanthobacteraceae bacterium]